jgi:hypothetical protein
VSELKLKVRWFEPLQEQKKKKKKQQGSWWPTTNANRAAERARERQRFFCGLRATLSAREEQARRRYAPLSRSDNGKPRVTVNRAAARNGHR